MYINIYLIITNYIIIRLFHLMFRNMKIQTIFIKKKNHIRNYFENLKFTLNLIFIVTFIRTST